MCHKCKVNETRNKNQYTCKECHNQYQKEYYKNNPQSINKSSIERKNKIRSIISEAKNVPCMDCNKKYPSYVMDFDHLSDKKYGIANMASRHTSIKTVMDEIAKCEVVCANCHRERTFSRY